MDSFPQLTDFQDLDFNNSSQGLFVIRKELDSAKSEQVYGDRFQFMGFLVADKEVLIDIAVVNEIIMMPPITYVPNAHNYIEGVINLRGNIIPVINLRKVMDEKPGEITHACRIIITKFRNELVGMIVDAITYVFSVSPDDIEQHTISLKSTSSEILTNICKIKDRLLGVIEIEKLVLKIKPEIDVVPGTEHAA